MHYSARLWLYLQTLDKAGKACQEKNTLAYKENLQITAVISFITLAPDHIKYLRANLFMNYQTISE
jgi:hypothetical protein